MFSSEALTLLKARYLRPNETPDDMFRRVARYIAQGERLYGRDTVQAEANYYALLSSLDFLPNSPTLMNSGKKNAQLAACFVLPIDDSLSSIFETLKHAALIHQSGGGTGFSFSRIRPRGDVVLTTGGAASGPVSFLQIYDAAAEVVKQGAVRSGANIAILRVDHPDILDFIMTKTNESRLNNFNISVGITDEFMKTLDENGVFTLINPRSGEKIKSLPARHIFETITEQAWSNGEPGLFFLDTVNRGNPVKNLGQLEAPNPCSEQPLLPYESCTLGSINLTNMVKSNNHGVVIDYQHLAITTHMAVSFLNNVIDVNHFPLDIIAETTYRTRKIGLGIMGLADLFIMLDIPYASAEAVELTKKIMRFITNEARRESQRLAKMNGVFPVFKSSDYERNNVGLMRNATVTTIAPTGSISIIAGCSSGIEPLFALATTKRILNGKNVTSINKGVVNYLQGKKLLNDRILDIIKKTGSIKSTTLPEHVKNVLATAHEIPANWHIAHLAGAQQYTDNGVSKTVNLPYSSTPDEVAEVFVQAYRLGCKGVTVYRDGSRKKQVINSGIYCDLCTLSD